MKTILFFLFFFTLTHSCFCKPFPSSLCSYYDIERSTHIDEDSVAAQKIVYNKHYKHVHGNALFHYRERIYYGTQIDILRDFSETYSLNELQITAFTKYPIASFFSATAVRIPQDKREKADSLYQQLVDQIFSLEYYKPISKIEIIVRGYTDLSRIEDDSTLYKELLVESQKDNLSEDEYQKYSSYFRAKEVGNIISALIYARKNDFTQYEKLIIDIIQEGRGVEYPDAKRSYEMIDDKRRISKVYWRIR